jgi:GTP cyclohydrolase I
MFNELEASLRKKYYGWEGAKHFEGTGERLKKAFEEFCWSNEAIEQGIENCFGAAYPDNYEELLVEGPISVWTLCPHHLLPCSFEVYVGYIPNELVLGLSKFARVAVLLGRRPIIQEMYSRELASTIQKKLAPKGVGVFVVGEHGCMRSRGALQKAQVTTSVLTGVIEHRVEDRAEFYAIVNSRRH